jgi:hypothetical protein
MTRTSHVAGCTCLILCTCLTAPRVPGQEPAQPRLLSAAETGCDSLHRVRLDSAYEADSVDRQVRAPYVRVTTLPYRMGEVRTGRTMLRFVVDSTGWVDRCTITLVEESSPDWTTAVLPAMKQARYEAARKDGRRVRQVVYQVFTYHSDGRTDVSQ